MKLFKKKDINSDGTINLDNGILTKYFLKKPSTINPDRCYSSCLKVREARVVKKDTINLDD